MLFILDTNKNDEKYNAQTHIQTKQTKDNNTIIASIKKIIQKDNIKAIFVN